MKAKKKKAKPAPKRRRTTKASGRRLISAAPDIIKSLAPETISPRAHALFAVADFFTDSRRVVEHSAMLEMGGANRQRAQTFFAAREALGITGYMEPRDALQRIIDRTSQIPVVKLRFERECRFCHCTDSQACQTPEGACRWLDIEDDVCSAPACRRRLENEHRTRRAR